MHKKLREKLKQSSLGRTLPTLMYKLKSLYFFLQKKNIKKTNWRTPRAPQTPKHTTNTFFEQTPKKEAKHKKGKIWDKNGKYPYTQTRKY